MGLKPDHWIRKMAIEQRMIEPFVEKQVRQGVISYGVSSYGYDIRVADEFKIFTNVYSAIVDPKDFDPKAMVDFRGDVCVIPPNSFVLAKTVEYFRIPRSVLTVCLGKCLTGDTRIVDAETGAYLPLREFVQQRRQRTVSLSDWKLGSEPVSDHVNNGLQPVFELTLRSGSKVTATATHPFRAWEGWLPLSSLRPGDRIAVARSIPVFGHEDWPEHEATLLGLLLADGQCQGNVRSADKFVPQVVFTARRERVAAFLRALFSGDGSVYGRDGVYLEYYTISERLAYDVRHLLLRFGIFTYVRSKALKTGGFAYTVQTTDPRMLRRFAEEIGFVPGSHKQANLDRLLAQIGDREPRRSNFDTLPSPAWANMRDAVHAAGYTLTSVGVRGTQPDQSLPYTIARQAAAAVADPEFSAVVDSDVVWDVVDSIEARGVQEVFDLTVPGTHNFVANDIIAHNSTYARCGLIVNVTPFEPEWEGYVTLEISNTTQLPAKVYANEGIAQVLFFEGDEVCEVSYADKKGKYQNQQSIELPKL